MIGVHVVDPSAFTPPYDHALCTALAARGAAVELITGEFAYGTVPPPAGYERRARFYRHAVGRPGSKLRRASKLAEHVPDMLSYRRRAAPPEADVVHFQWLDVPWLDRWLLPRTPVVLTAHDLLPREPRPGQLAAQRSLLRRVDAVVVHSQYGRAQLLDGLGLDPAKVHVIHHGAFEHLVPPDASGLPAASDPLPPELAATPPERPVALFFGLLRPYKGVDVLLRAWREVPGAELWIVGRPMMDLGPLKSSAPPSVRWIERFVSDEELPALFRRADLVVLPYARTERFDQSGVLATALAYSKPALLSDIGGFSEVAQTGAARIVPPGDVSALAGALIELLGDPRARAQMSEAARAAAAGAYSWRHAAERTLALYESLLATRTG
ncbi:MAG: glycosyltransferase family 4 protein [Solirubrobacteraceae bacterium]